MPLYRAAPATVQSGASGQAPAGGLPVLPGRGSRSTRRRCYPSDMSDHEWAVCEPLLPHPAWLAGQGRPPAGCTACAMSWTHPLPDAQRAGVAGAARGLPARRTIYYWAAKWQADGSTETMHGQLRERVRLVAGRNRVPSAAIIDSQSVKAAEEAARSSRGYDAGKKINGRYLKLGF